MTPPRTTRERVVRESLEIDPAAKMARLRRHFSFGILRIGDHRGKKMYFRLATTDVMALIW
jgi:hypothetical protein